MLLMLQVKHYSQVIKRLDQGAAGNMAGGRDRTKCTVCLSVRPQRQEEVAGHMHTATTQLVFNWSLRSAERDRSVLPLIRGAWLGKPSKRKPFKRRFFQLSADGASLRWWAFR